MVNPKTIDLIMDENISRNEIDENPLCKKVIILVVHWYEYWSMNHKRNKTTKQA